MFELPELDRKATQQRVEAHLEKYRLYKYLDFEEREANVTPSYEARSSSSNNISDQTANIAIYNSDNQEERKKFCERTERAVKRLPALERFLIEERYMSAESEYITDYHVYYHKFQPPISHVKYSKIRWKAFYRLALNLNLVVLK